MNAGLTRRMFFKAAAFLGAATAWPSGARGEDGKTGAAGPAGGDTEAPALCKRCSAICMMRIRIADGRAVGVEGYPGHPVGGGALCPKGFVELQELYHPDRLTGPLRRAGSRKGAWEKISWEEAGRLLAEHLGALLSRGRPERLGVVAAPIRDIRHELQREFARAFGTPNIWEWDWAPGEPPRDAFRLMHGGEDGLVYDLADANHVVSFGWDWLQAHPSPVEAQRAYSRLRRSRLERRTRMVQVESRLSVTATKADTWIPARPGTEGVLALGVAHVLIRDGLHDRGFIERWTTGYGAFKELVLRGYAPERVAGVTGVEPEQIVELAHEMGRIRPSLAITSRGSLRDQVAVHCLNALTGSIGVRRGVLATQAAAHQLNLGRRPAPANGRAPLSSLHALPEALTAGSAVPLDVLWLERVNCAFAEPSPERWRRALARVPFVVCFSPFLDETASLADLVLPPHASLEAWQYGFATAMDGRGVLSFAPPVMAPRHQTGDHGDFVLTLAHALGGKVAAALPWRTFVEALEEAAGRAGVGARMRTGGWWASAPARTGVAATLAEAGGRKLRFPVEALAEPGGARDDPEYPLRLHVHVPLAYARGEGGHLPYLHSLAGPHLGEEWETWVEVHPATARRLGVADRAMVRVESAAGGLTARARHVPGIREDTVSLPFGLGHTAMGRHARGVGSNPAEIVPYVPGPSGVPLWQGTPVRIHAV